MRVVTGLLLAGHGIQKVSFHLGGEGLAGGVQEFRNDGFRGGVLTALTAGGGQIVGGLLFVAGAATPLAAATAIGVMTVATTVKWANGPWAQNNGYEYPGHLVVTSAVLALTGSGRWSVDRAVTSTPWPVWVNVAAIALGIAGGLHPPHAAPPSPHRPPRKGRSMTSESSETTPANRRTFLKTAAAAVTAPTAAALVGGTLSGTAQAATAADLPDFAPIPAAATGPALNAQGYFVGRVSGNLYWVTDAFYQAMFLSTREGVVLVDAPPTIGHNLLRAIADVTRANGRPSKVTHLVYSHSHADHIGAANLFGKDVVRIAHRETRRLLLLDADPNRPIPTVTFDDRFDLHVGGERLELAHHGPNHSPDNIFIHAPDHATLMVVDVLYPGWVPFKNLAVSQDIPAWVKAQDIAMSYPWRTLVGGHLGRLGVRADGDMQRRYVADLTASTKAAMSLDPTPYFQKYGPAGNSWAIFKTYLDAVAKQAADPIVAKYTGVLAAADVFTVDNCFAMLESLRIDAGVLGPFATRP